MKTNKTQTPTPEKTIRLFSIQPFGNAKTTGTPTTRIKDSATKAKSVNWKIVVINLINKFILIILKIINKLLKFLNSNFIIYYYNKIYKYFQINNWATWDLNPEQIG